MAVGTYSVVEPEKKPILLPRAARPNQPTRGLSTDSEPPNSEDFYSALGEVVLTRETRLQEEDSSPPQAAKAPIASKRSPRVPLPPSAKKAAKKPPVPPKSLITVNPNPAYTKEKDLLAHVMSGPLASAAAAAANTVGKVPPHARRQKQNGVTSPTKSLSPTSSLSPSPSPSSSSSSICASSHAGVPHASANAQTTTTTKPHSSLSPATSLDNASGDKPPVVPKPRPKPALRPKPKLS